MFGCRHGRFSTQPTRLEKVTQAYFSLEKRASPWGSPEVSTPILSTQPTRLEKVTQAYFSLEKRASPWGFGDDGIRQRRPPGLNNQMRINLFFILHGCTWIFIIF